MTENKQLCTDEDMFSCPIALQGKCFFIENIKHQSINGCSESGWTREAWDNYLIRTMRLAKIYCLNPGEVMLAFTNHEPTFDE